MEIKYMSTYVKYIQNYFYVKTFEVKIFKKLNIKNTNKDNISTYHI